jgi:hypothetical protein
MNMRYPIEKYQVVKHQHPEYLGVEIIARSSYAGETVKGKAICHEGDTYNEEKGIKLAVARCAEKIAKKRVARAARLLKKANEQLVMAQKYVADMTAYHTDAVAELVETQSELADILAQL